MGVLLLNFVLSCCGTGNVGRKALAGGVADGGEDVVRSSSWSSGN